MCDSAPLIPVTSCSHLLLSCKSSRTCCYKSINSCFYKRADYICHAIRAEAVKKKPRPGRSPLGKTLVAGKKCAWNLAGDFQLSSIGGREGGGPPALCERPCSCHGNDGEEPYQSRTLLKQVVLTRCRCSRALTANVKCPFTPNVHERASKGGLKEGFVQTI